MAFDTLVRLKYSGAMSGTSTYIHLIMQTGGVLIGGIILWRMSARMHQRKQAERADKQYFQTRYSGNWKNR